MALGYAWFDSYDSVGYVLTLHIFPHTVCHRSLGMGRYGGHFLLQGGEFQRFGDHRRLMPRVASGIEMSANPFRMQFSGSICMAVITITAVNGKAGAQGSGLYTSTCTVVIL